MRIKTLQMKKTVFAVLVGLLLSVAGVTNAFAQTFTVGNLNYSVNDDGVSVTVTGHVDGTNATGELVIPENVEYYGNSYPVTKIRESAFSYCPGLTGSLVIPNSVITIEQYAFEYDSGLTGSLTIGNSVQYIGNCSFRGCGFTGSLTISGSVTTIGSDAFQCGFTGVITIPENIQNIGSSVFYGCNFTTLNYNAINCYVAEEECCHWLVGCSSLTTVNIGENVHVIPNNFLYGCSNLTGELIIPETVTYIGENAFNGCSGFSGSLTVPNSVTSIGANAFSGCGSLSGILTLGSSLTEIGNNAFFGACEDFTSLNVLTETPPTLGANVFSSVEYGIPVTVPCGKLEAYQNALGWSDFTNLQEPSVCMWEIAANANPYLGGTISGAGTYEGGQTCTLTATPNDDYAFVNWMENGEVVSSEASYFFTVSGDRNLVANFRFIRYYVRAIVQPEVAGTVNGNEPGISEVFYYNFDDGMQGWTTIDANADGYDWVLGSQTSGVYTVESVNYSGQGHNSSANMMCSGSYSNITSLPITPDNYLVSPQVELGGILTFYACAQDNLYAAEHFGVAVSMNGNTDPNYFQMVQEWTMVAKGVGAPNGVTRGDNRNQGNWYQYTVDLGAYSGLGYVAIRHFNCYNQFILCVDDISVITDEGCVGSYLEGESCTLIASPKENWTFYRWEENGEILSTEEEYCFTVSSNRHLIAKFKGINTIVFTDPNVEAICVANWDTDGDGLLSYAEAAAVTDLGNAFQGNTAITSFAELQYFTGLTSIGNAAFQNCYNLTGELTIPESVTYIGGRAFENTGFSTVNFNATNCNQIGSEGYDDYWNWIWFPAFYNCSITTLNIGENVQTIPYRAFEGLSTLSGTLTLPVSLTSIGDNAFYNCSGLTGELIIPNSVTSIGLGAFANCVGFTSLTIGTGLENIGGYDRWTLNQDQNPFYNCSGITTLNYNAVDCYYIPIEWYGDSHSPFAYLSSLTTLNIGIAVQKIPDFAFDGCESLTGTLNIPNSVTSIGAEAFRNCSGLTGTITIPESVTSIGGGAFDGCTGLGGTLTINPSIIYIGPRAFAYTGIEIVNFNATNCNDIGDYYQINPTPTYHSSISRFGFAFEGCENFTTLNIGNGVERIPESAFSNCSSLSGELTIPNSVTYIGSWAFYDCNSLTGSLIIPNSVITILYGSFGNCSGLNGTLTLGEGLQSVCGNAFENTGFTAMNYNAVNCFVGSVWTDDYSNETYYEVQTFVLPPSFNSLSFGSNVESISQMAFKDCTTLTSTLTLPNSLKSIGDQAFYNCYGLEGIVMGNAVETIGAEAFRNCGGLRGELTLPETLQSVGNYAFASCDELTTINYNAVNCTAMGNAQQPVFYDCASMAHINIGENVESIPNYAFKRCSTVTDMTVAATVPPTVGSSTFGTLQRSIPVTVQCGTTAAYQAAQYWNEFTNYNEGFNYVLEVNCDPERGTVVVNKMADCDDPTARVTAYPEMGYAFLGWSENGTLVSEANPYTFTMESSRELQAEFIPGVSYSVTVTVVPAVAGTVTGQGNYNDGSAVTLTATTNPGYAFVNWTENGSVVSTDEEYTFTIHANRNLVANFTPYAYHWDVNIHQYPGNMTAIGVIQIDGVEQTTPTLEIGAFCNDECRGRQLLTYYPQVDRYMVFLMLYGEDGDEMSFKLYDHILEQELMLSCTSLVTFAANTAMGNPVNPYVFNFINSQQTPLAEGWTWYSTYIEQEDIEGLQMMTEALNESGVMIKSQTGFIANSGGQWMGNLDEITNESMYMVNTTAATLLDMVGNSAIASQHPITMNSGWNWIGYPMATANSVSVALSDLEAQPNDVLKSQESFATYYEGMGWFGSLNTITPGMGLMYDSKNDAPVTFTYTEGRSGELKRNVTAESNHWVPDMHKYTNNMNVMAVVELDDVELRDSRYELAVFAGNECRGSVRLVYVEPIDRYVAFLTVAGREATDLQFVLFDADENREYGNAKESLVFESDAVVGNTKSMMTVHFASCEQENDWSKIAVYPNPADGGEHFSIVLPAASDQKVRVEIINELGAVVSVAQSSSLPMEMKAPATPGLYTLKIVAEGNAVCFRKLVVK